MDRLKEKLEGKKTYITAFLAAAFAAAEVLGCEIPGGVYVVLSALGFTFLRAGVTKSGRL